MHRQVDIVRDPRISLRSHYVAKFKHKVGQHFFMLSLITGIAVLDQTVKWWAWRTAPGVRINYGGDLLVPASVGSLYAHPVTGALLDLLDSGLLIAAASLFLRRRRSPLTLVSGSVIIGGWTSNLLDRLFMHYWTAPGSVRGVVDFLPLGQHRYNVADIFIASGTVSFILTTSGRLLRRFFVNRPAIHRDLAPRTYRRPLVRRAMSIMAVQVVLIAVVGTGAANFGGATVPVTSASIDYQPTLLTRDGLAYETP
jgi:lipoprotein signal peptidase